MDELELMSDTNAMGMLGAMLGVVVVIGLVAYAFYGFCYGKMFEKAGKPLWAGFVPIYNIVVWLEIIGRPWWWLLVLIGVGMVPIVGTFAVLALMVVFGIDTARSFGKDTAFGVLFGILSFIFLPILAFSRDIQYVGPRASGLGAPPLDQQS